MKKPIYSLENKPFSNGRLFPRETAQALANMNNRNFRWGDETIKPSPDRAAAFACMTNLSKLGL